MSSVFDQGPPAPCPSPFNMAAHVLAPAALDPDKIALSVVGPQIRTDWTFAQIERSVLGLAGAFLETGLKPGDRVLLRLGNTPYTPLAYLAAIAVDMLPTPASPQLTEPEVARLISDLSPKLVLWDTDLPCPAHPMRIEASQLPDLAQTPPANCTPGNPDRPAYIVYTSGTSGKPRAVVHAHRAIWARRMMMSGWYDLRQDDRVLHAGAFNWTYTMGTGLMDPWSIGATALIPEPGTLPKDLPGLISDHSASIFAAAPGVYRKLLTNEQTVKAPQLRHGLSAGEKMSPAIRKSWEHATGTPVYEAYGMSECSTFISASLATPARPDTSGAPQPGRKIAVLDASHIPCPRDVAGTIAIDRTDPGLMLGYLNAPEETAARFASGWFLTGDRGIMHDDDQITFLGRDDDMMNVGGYRVAPLEVESALSEATKIGQIAVTDIEIKPDVQIIAAFYTGQASVSDLDTFARDCLAAYKCPRAWIHVPQLPTGPNGKLLRKDLVTLWRAS